MDTKKQNYLIMLRIHNGEEIAVDRDRRKGVLVAVKDLKSLY